MKPGLAVVFVVAAWSELCGCDMVVTGDGVGVASQRATGPFHAIDAKTSLDVEVTQGDTLSVVVTTDENLVQLISTEVVGDTLEIEQADNLRPGARSVVTIVVPALVAVDLNGSGAMIVNTFSSPVMHLGNAGSGPLTATIHADTLDVASSGSGSTTVDGDANMLALALGGSGSVDATRLPTHGAHVHHDGSGSASIVVSGDSQIEASGSGTVHAVLDNGGTILSVDGSGSIRWSGNAHVISETRSGSGTIVHEG